MSGRGRGGRQLWTCAYCSVTINDDAPSRRQHEAGLRHKSNVQRAIGEQYARASGARRASEAAAREMARIEAAARAAVGAAGASAPPGGAPAASRPVPRAATHKKAAGAPSKASYGSLLQDQLVRRQQRGDGVPGVAPGAPQTAGVPGEWETVQPDAAPAPAGPARPAGPPAQAPAPFGARPSGLRLLKPSARSAGGRGEPSERVEARAFVLAEKTAGWGEGDDDGADELVFGSRGDRRATGLRASLPGADRASDLEPPSKRARIKLEDSGGDAARSIVKIEPGSPEPSSTGAVKEEDGAPGLEPDGPGGLARPEGPDRPETVVKTEPDDELARVEPKAEPVGDSVPPPVPEAPPGGGGLFKKRKAGTGRGTKKIVI